METLFLSSEMNRKINLDNPQGIISLKWHGNLVNVSYNLTPSFIEKLRQSRVEIKQHLSGGNTCCTQNTRIGAIPERS